MTESPLRRIAAVLLGYAAVTWVVLKGSDWLRRVLALPELFETLLVAGLVLGVPVAVLMAWKYPELGHGGKADGGQLPATPAASRDP